jgi:hypothetical protein
VVSSVIGSGVIEGGRRVVGAAKECWSPPPLAFFRAKRNDDLRSVAKKRHVKTEKRHGDITISKLGKMSC